jgi:hypothetical protein
MKLIRCVWKIVDKHFCLLIQTFISLNIFFTFTKVAKSHIQMFRPEMSECRTGKPGYITEEKKHHPGELLPLHNQNKEAFLLAVLFSTSLQGCKCQFFPKSEWTVDGGRFLYFGNEKRKLIPPFPKGGMANCPSGHV